MLILNEEFLRRQVTPFNIFRNSNGKINHFLYVDGLKLLSLVERQIDKLIKTQQR